MECGACGAEAESVSVTESEWTPNEVALLLASRRHEKSFGSHGIPMAEATDPDNQFAFTTGKVMDWAERTRLDAIDAHKKEHPKQNTNGLMFPVRRRT